MKKRPSIRDQLLYITEVTKYVDRNPEAVRAAADKGYLPHTRDERGNRVFKLGDVLNYRASLLARNPPKDTVTLKRAQTDSGQSTAIFERTFMQEGALVVFTVGNEQFTTTRDLLQCMARLGARPNG